MKPWPFCVALCFLLVGAGIVPKARAGETNAKNHPVASTQIASTEVPKGGRSFDRTHVPSRTEITALAQLFEMASYTRDSVRSKEIEGSLVEDFMLRLDPERAVFLAEDRDFLQQKAASPMGVYAELRRSGNIEAAYTIFERFQRRWSERQRWIVAALANEVHERDCFEPWTRRSAWFKSEDESDRYWRDRVQYELNVARLSFTDGNQARKRVQQHIFSIGENLAKWTGNDVTELFLQTLTAVYDPHSSYFSPTTMAAFRDTSNGIVGVGFQLATIGASCVVAETLSGGPAAGQIIAGDRVLGVEDTATTVAISGLPIQQVTYLMKGPENSKVGLRLQADGLAAPPRLREVTVIRRGVDPEVGRVRGAVFAVPNSSAGTRRIGVVTLPALYGALDDDPESQRTSAKDVASLLRRMANTNVDAVVVDLRHNGGGYLSEAADVAGLFVPGKVVMTVRNYNGVISTSEAPDTPQPFSGPVVVLVDSQTSSGAEILAGALQDHGRALIVGEGPTHGTGTIQQVIELRHIASGLREKQTGAATLTIQKFFLPSGRSTQLSGITPDVVVNGIDDPRTTREADERHTVDRETISIPKPLPPPDSSSVQRLRTLSAQRQSELPEFEWLRKRQQALRPHSVPLQPANWGRYIERREEERRGLSAQAGQLAANAFSFEPMSLRVGPEPTPEPSLTDSIDPKDFIDYRRFDVPLREALRIARDMAAH